MNAPEVAKAISRIHDAMWLPRIASWEIAQTDGTWGAHGELIADDSVAAVMALTKLASEVGSELMDKDRLFTVDFMHGAVPVRVWWLRPIVPVLNATAPVLLSELAQSEHELTGARLSLWEEEQDTRRLRLALKAASRGRSQARERGADLETLASNLEDELTELREEYANTVARVAELEAERHTTNEALDDTVKAIRDANTAAGLVAEYRVPTEDGRWLSVRREPNGDRWAIFTSHLIAGRRRAWVGDRWQELPAYGDNGPWEFDSADAALAEATRLADPAKAMAS
jgi:hypothetical protein